MSMLEFLNVDMKGKLILFIYLPKREDYWFRSFKITRRYQNAHAYVNAAFLLKVDKTSLMVTERPRLCFGGISANFVSIAL